MVGEAAASAPCPTLSTHFSGSLPTHIGFVQTSGSIHTLKLQTHSRDIYIKYLRTNRHLYFELSSMHAVTQVYRVPCAPVGVYMNWRWRTSGVVPRSTLCLLPAPGRMMYPPASRATRSPPALYTSVRGCPLRRDR